MATYLAEDFIVRDDLRERTGGRVSALLQGGGLIVRDVAGNVTHAARAQVQAVEVTWPDGAVSRYGLTAAREFLEVEREGLLDLFRLGVEL